MNNTLEGINSRITEAEEWTNDLEDRMVEITAAEQNIEKKMKTVWDLWDIIKHTNIRIIGVPGGEERKKQKISEETIAENFPNVGKEVVNQVQENRVSGRINPKRNTPRHIVIKLTKTKDRDKTLKATREKWQITYKGTTIRLSSWFLNRHSMSKRRMARYI